MPGVELQFMQTGFDVAGKLICQGTEEDSIIFTTAIIQPELVRWDGIDIHDNFADSIYLSYCRIEYVFQSAIKITNSYLQIKHCVFSHNDGNLINFDVSALTYGIVEYNYFDSSNDTFSAVVLREGICRYNHSNDGGIIFLASCYYPLGYGAVAEYNLIENGDDGISASDSGIVRYNEIRNVDGSGISNSAPSHAVFYSNYIWGCDTGIKHWYIYVPTSLPYFYNNVIEECDIGFNLSSGYNDTSFIYNNVFRNCGVAFRSTNSYADDVIPIFQNNCIMNCDTAFYKLTSLPLLYSYNNIYGCLRNYVGFPYLTGALVTINANGDSCDTNQNIYLEPRFGGGEPFDYHLCWGSPLIDAGNPAPDFFDLDSTVNDIGLYGGSYGESYPYLEVSHYQKEEIPAQFSLSQNYPNPFNAGTVFYYTLPQPANVTVIISNVLGQRVRTFKFDNQPLGIHRVEWDGAAESGNKASNGIYIYQVKAGAFEASKVMIMVK